MTVRWLALSASLAAVSCHAALLRLERGGTAAITHPDEIDLKTFFDRRYVPLPAKAFSNCFDAVLPELPTGTCALPASPALPDDCERLADYTGYAYDTIKGADGAPGWLRSSSSGDVVKQLGTVRRCIEQDERALTYDRDRARPVLSFVHLSDAQIRDPGAKLGGAAISETLDPLISTFAHDYEQELFSYYYYEAMIRTVVGERREDRRPTPDKDFVEMVCRFDDSNKTEADVVGCIGKGEGQPTDYRIPPTFMIHTGDAIDAGLMSEFRDFRSASDLLDIPWYSMIGNHDILGIGNLQLDPCQRASKDDGGNASRRYACTSIDTLVREYYLDVPRGNGEWGEVPADDGRPTARVYSLATAILADACLSLDVEGDRLVGDRTSSDGDAVCRDNRLYDESEKRYRTGAREFVEAHCRGGSVSDDGNDLRECLPHTVNSKPVAYPGDSRLNGFDLQHDPGKPSDPYPGYYVFSLDQREFQGRSRALWMVVLNTASEGGAYGSLCNESFPSETNEVDPLGKEESGEARVAPSSCPQLRWLERALDARKHDLVIVSAHHAIFGIENAEERAWLKKILFKHGNVLAYFAGHTHSPGLRVIEEDASDKKNTTIGDSSITCPQDDKHAKVATCRRGVEPVKRLWEIVAPSTLEYPQLGRQVTLFAVPGTDLAYFEYLSFEPHPRDRQDALYVERARAGAKRDYCHEHPKRCTQGEPHPPEQYLTHARLWLRIPSP